MSIKDLHEWIRYMMRHSGYVSHEKIDEALHRGSMDLFIDLYGNDKSYQAGRPVPPTVYGETIFIHAGLEPFKDKHPFTTTTSPGGLISMPDDCEIPLALHTFTFSEKLQKDVSRRVELLNEEEVIDRLDSQLAPISLYNPVALISDTNKIQLYPEQPQKGIVYYLRTPKKPKFAYTVVGRSEVFDEENSQDLEWKEIFINRVVNKALAYLGLRLSDGEISQFAELKDNKGS